MKHSHAKVLFVIGAAFGGAAAAASYHLNAALNAPTPQNPICWQTQGTDLYGYALAHEADRAILRELPHRTADTARCTGEINGRLVEWRSAQVWIAPADGVPKASGH